MLKTNKNCKEIKRKYKKNVKNKTEKSKNHLSTIMTPAKNTHTHTNLTYT